MNKKEIVIEVARDLFTKYGYRKVSMDEIAKQSNVTKKTIYTYFKDKEELYRYFIKEELEAMKNNIEKKEKSNLSFIELIARNIYDMLSYRKYSLFFNNIVKENDNLDTNFLKIYDDEILSYLETKIEKEINLGNIKKCNVHLTSFIIYKIFIDVMFNYDKEIDEKKVTKEIISILKDGLLN